MAFASWHERYVSSGKLDEDWANLDRAIAGLLTAVMAAVRRLLLAGFPVVLAAW